MARPKPEGGVRSRAPQAEPLPRLTLPGADHDVRALLRAATQAVLAHPVAAQAAFSALVAEGRRYAHTPAGARWRTVLAGSDLVRRGRVLWEASPLSLLEPDAEVILPSTLIDAVVRATHRTDLLRVLQLLADPPPRGDDDAA